MEKEQYDKLMEAASKNAYMSIAVNEDGSPQCEQKLCRQMPRFLSLPG